MSARSRQVIIAGAGIAGLSAALAFAQRGFSVQLYERSRRLEEVGAGIQLSPNATRLLGRFGVLDAVMPTAIKPEAIVLVDGKSLRRLAQIPLGEAAERRWGAPYLVVHRSDLQSALAARVTRDSDIALRLGAAVRDFTPHPHGLTASVDIDGRISEASGLLLVGADGVWSTLRAMAGHRAESRPTGQIAWRTTVRSDGPAGQAFAAIADAGMVTVFLHRSAHIVAYPLRGGGAVNLVAVTKGTIPAEMWAARPEQQALDAIASRMAPGIARLVAAAGPWTAWPIHTVPSNAPWIATRGVALIGDAAHAMTPFAAQGAAMAIEDAYTLAERIAAARFDIAAALVAWEKQRRRRVSAVARRGRLNKLAWNAGGPAALVRNAYLRRASSDRLASGLDWLYGWRP
ncbi:MAG: FAD-dependent monooxygenase [Rhizobiaceae bacterium]|nr:FAD-dependent monooxygenase [Rhizobiaceae bacterium]